MLKFAYLADLEFRMLERLMLSYIWRWLPAEDSGPDQRRLVLLDSYVLEHADLPLIFSDRYVWSQNGWDSHKFGQVVVSSLNTPGGVSPRILRITVE